MGFAEWLLLIAILVNAFKTYQRQGYWLDRQTAKLIRFVKSLFH